MSNSDITAAARSYLRRYPEDHERLAAMLAELASGADLTSPAALPGHVTCSAVALNEHGLMLVIWHRTLRLWLQPGGHIDPADDSLAAAARRELAEETGLTVPDSWRCGDGQLPVDIDVGIPIPANPARNMPAHWHTDFMYLFYLQRPLVRLELSEVSGYDWRSPADVYGQRLADRIRQRAGRGD